MSIYRKRYRKTPVIAKLVPLIIIKILIMKLFSTEADGADEIAAQADEHTTEDGGQRRRHGRRHQVGSS